jgi:DNA polymerase-1
VSNEFEGADGRVHPFHRQLGTHTGRQTSKWPNILGLERVLRPLIVPDPGCGIGEVDYSQIEVGIAAAVYQDSKLIEMYNSEDVYSAMAQHFYSNRLSEEDRSLPGSDFKRKHPELRELMKTCTLGIIYGITAHGLSLLLNTRKTEATILQERFMNMFPQLQGALVLASAFGAIRGYATTMTGLRRYRAKRGRVSNWEKNWLTNHPVQGSAAVVFKVAGNRLDVLYQQYNARLIIPLHDAFVFEAPLEVLNEVALLTERVMCETVREYFPELRPKAEVNIRRLDCWNKDGDADALIRWLEDPLMEVGIKGCPPC